jgi:hypothetical protein
MELMAESQDGSFRLPLMLLCEGTKTRECPITCEAMDAEYMCPWFKDGQTPCPPLMQPPLAHMNCLRVVWCGHEFNARALVMHFLRNSMSCPLCRHGHTSAKLAVESSFPGVAPWAVEAEHRVCMQQEEPRVLIGLMPMLYHPALGILVRLAQVTGVDEDELDE